MLHPEKDLLTSPLGVCHQLTANYSFRLVAWKQSGGCLKSQGFPDEVMELLLSATRANTNASEYQRISVDMGQLV